MTDQDPPTLLDALADWPEIQSRMAKLGPNELARLDHFWRESGMSVDALVRDLKRVAEGGGG